MYCMQNDNSPLGWREMGARCGYGFVQEGVMRKFYYFLQKGLRGWIFFCIFAADLR